MGSHPAGVGLARGGSLRGSMSSCRATNAKALADEVFAVFGVTNVFELREVVLRMRRDAEQAQWCRTDSDTAFASPFGTVRTCRGCGCLVAGGPTACTRCVDGEHPSKETKT